MSTLNITNFKIGKIKLSDGTILRLRVAIVNVRKIEGFSPFGGVNLAVKAVGGVGSISVPDELRKAVADKPLLPPDRPPKEGWEFVRIEEQEPAFEEAEVTIDGNKFLVRVEAEALMAVRNLKYRTEVGEPMYVVNWVNKVTWSPIEESKGEGG